MASALRPRWWQVELRARSPASIAAMWMLAGAMAPACAAGLTVIHEGGPTVPISQYLSGFFTQDPSQAAPAKTSPPAQIDLPMDFPVRTPSMSPGRMTAPVRLQARGWLTTPVFLIGDDPMSRQWLVSQRDRLMRSGAMGLVVKCDSLASFRSLQQLAPGLQMVPASMEDLAARSGLTTYPALMRPDGLITQQATP